MAHPLPFGLLAACIGSATTVEQSIVIPWRDAQADTREVIEITATVPRRNCLVGLALSGPAGARLRVAAADALHNALPIHRDDRGRVWLQLKADLTPNRPRRLVASWSKRPDWLASPVLADKPVDGDDYATTAYGDAWDFDEGDQEGIDHWGDRRHHYGEVTVRDGTLVIPVTGNDPYFIWGTMFGPGDADRDEHIDSRMYTMLSMRVRQSCTEAEWTLFVTDTRGAHKSHGFTVRGTAFGVFRFDLPRLFPEFWDGREFRALRIDTTNDRPGTTVEVDWVRLSRSPATVHVGPVLTAADVKARGRVKRVRVALPPAATAGQTLPIEAAGLDDRDDLVPGAPLALALHDDAGRLTSCVVTRGATAVAVGERAGKRGWVLGVSDDLGRPAEPLVRAPLTIHPAELCRYELLTRKRLVPVTQREATLAVWGADRFGNRIGVDVPTPKWTATGGARAPDTPLRGAPATVTVTCAATPRVRHEMVLRDTQGHTGKVVLTTLAHKRRPIRLDPNGYLIGSTGDLYMPLGGFYANWPAGMPNKSGAITRAVDLFPCNVAPYPHGFPWSAEVERQVAGYLRLCKRHGVTGLRLMLRNMDIVGRVDPVQLKAVLRLFDLARPLGIRFNVALFEDYTKPPYVNRRIVEKIALPRYTAAELADLPPHRRRFLVEKRVLSTPGLRYVDRDAIRCQKDYVDELLPYLTDREEVFCYEFENEMVHPPMSWVNEMAENIRRIDPQTPIIGNPGPHNWPEPWRWRGAKIDLLSYHPYNNGLPGADHGAVIFMRSKWAAAAGIPMFTGEGGINQSRWSPKGQTIKKAPPDVAARGIRDQIWLSLASGANGAFMWAPEHELEMAEFGKVLPALEAIGIDLRRIKRRRPRTVVVMPEDGSANDRGCALGYALLSRGVDFDARPATAAGKYEVRLDATQAAPASLDVVSELFAPTDGYQLAYLASDDQDQVLVYLRNVAGGVVNLGVVRPCHVRRRGPAGAGVRLAGNRRWSTVKAFDLDERSAVAVEVRRANEHVIVAEKTTHDYVIGLRR